MKLIVLLNEKYEPTIDNIDSTIILTNINKHFQKYKMICETYFIDYSLEDENPKVAEEIRIFFDRLPNEYRDYSNIWHTRFFRPIFSIVRQIDDLITRREIKEIVLTGGSEHIFVAINAAEGEGEKLFYKSEWLINAILYRYYNGNKRLKIIWNNKKNKYVFRFLNNSREIVQILAIAFMKILKSIKNRSKNYSLNKLNPKKNAIIIANLPLQISHMEAIIKTQSHINTYFVLPSNIKIEQKTGYIKSKPLTTNLVLMNLLNCKKKLISNRSIYFYLKGSKIEIPSKYFERTTRILKFQTDCKVCELINSIQESNLSKSDYILTDMTYGREIIEANRVAGHFGMKHINIQYVAMSKIILPKMRLADVYYMYAKKTYDLYKKYSDTYRYYLPIIAEPKIINKKNEKIRITVFTQPDSYTDRYLKFIGELFDQLDNSQLDVEVQIKPHYRQDKIDEFSRIVDNCSFSRLCRKDENVKELILESDIIVSMTSSVLFEAMMLGKMAIVAGVDSVLKPLIYDNDICFPEVNFVIETIPELINIIDNFDIYYSKYIDRYYEFIDDIGGVADFDEIFKTI